MIMLTIRKVFFINLLFSKFCSIITHIAVILIKYIYMYTPVHTTLDHLNTKKVNNIYL